jgi:hypothetical protein
MRSTRVSRPSMIDTLGKLIFASNEISYSEWPIIHFNFIEYRFSLQRKTASPEKWEEPELGQAMGVWRTGAYDMAYV